jgi:hypothetical protein
MHCRRYLRIGFAPGGSHNRLGDEIGRFADDLAVTVTVHLIATSVSDG